MNEYIPCRSDSRDFTPTKGPIPEDFEKYYRRRRLKESGLFFGGLAVIGGVWYIGNRYIDWGWQVNNIIGFLTAVYMFDYMIFGFRI